MSRTFLVTGAAGFIGFHTSRRLLDRGDRVVGLDNVNDYYDVALKHRRLELLRSYKGFVDVRDDIVDAVALDRAFAQFHPSKVVHLAAEVGVRASVERPVDYVQSNIVGFANVLDCCQRHGVEHLVYASSSSVYGGSTRVPFATTDSVDQPKSVYAATKKANELLAHAYSDLHGLPTTGLRFFTVYGPWGRPDMALSLFARAIVDGEPIKVFNHGHMLRDFTYVDDVVEAILRAVDVVPHQRGVPDSGPALPTGLTHAPYRVFNVGGGAPVRLGDFITQLEEALGRSATRELMPIQPGEAQVTHADVSGLERELQFRPSTPLKEGLRAFVSWFLHYYGPAQRPSPPT